MLNREGIARQLHDLLELPIPDKSNIRCAKGSKIVSAVIKSITSALQRGESVTVQGFGTFEVVERRAKRLPGNYYFGEQRSKTVWRDYPAKKVVKFKPSSILKRIVNEPQP